MNRISDKWAWLLFVVLWGIVIAVADMNWPEHMGGAGHLMSALMKGPGLGF
jgi:hypothetical protein